MSLTGQVPDLVIDALTSPRLDTDAGDVAILDAVLRCVTRYGVERMTVEDVARTAGVGRATVFRRFQSKDELIRRAFALEMTRVTKYFSNKVGAIQDPCERLVELVVETVRFSRTHPVGNRLIEDDTALTVHRDQRIASFQLAVLRQQITLCADQLAGDIDVEALSEVLLRFLGSVWMAPDIGRGIDDETYVRRMARSVLAPLLPSGNASG